jgi:hypothetical protein
MKENKTPIYAVSLDKFVDHLLDVSSGQDEEWDEFVESVWTIQFMGKAVRLPNGPEVFDRLYELLREYQHDFE